MNDDTARRLERLELIEIAKFTTVRYGRAVDAKDLDDLRAGIFSADVVLRTPKAEYRGIDEVVGFYTGAFAAEPGTRRHFLTNQIVDVTASDRIEVDSYFFFVSADATSVIGWGNYQDVVLVRDGVARIAEKTIGIDVRTTVDHGWASPSLARQ